MKTVRNRKEEELEVEKISAPLLREKPGEPPEENESGYHGSSSPSPPPPSSYQPFGEENSPVEQVALTVPVTDDPTLPVVTFRMWVLGILACVLLSFLNQFFWFRREPLFISSISAQIAVVPLGRLMASAVTRRVFFKGRKWEFSLNPGPFNVKEHVLITIFANSGVADPFSIFIVIAVKVFYKRTLNFRVALVVVLTTQVLGFGWAGIFRRYWWSLPRCGGPRISFKSPCSGAQSFLIFLSHWSGELAQKKVRGV